ncbi:MAG: ribosome-associated translation inhibitor RaiA [Actinomycetaceae bacterium]|nr:ribosome-associated translation inhibitor RaiA [Actinomycetaceae bacterium]
MEIIVNGRNADIHPNFRQYVEDKVAKVELFYPRVQRVNVELTHEPNPARAETAEKIELTVIGKGPIIRAEARSSDRYASVDIAAGKLYERLRRARDRAKDHRRRKGRIPKDADVTNIEQLQLEDAETVQELTQENQKSPSDLKVGDSIEDQLGDSPVIVRQKLHEATLMSVSEALYQMELVGHNWFLFIDSETMQPCVVYRRRGWTYGVIRLDAVSTPKESKDQDDG